MNKKKIIFPVLAALSFLVVGCNGTTPSTSTSTSNTPTSESSSKEEPVAKTYTVTFNSKGGSAVKKQTIKEGEKANRPADPTKGGYKFVNWYTEDTYVNVYDFNTPVTSDITLYANWKLSTDSTLVSSLPYYSTQDDSELSVFSNFPGFVMHAKEGGWAGGTFNMSWRTIVIVDAEGRVCFGVWCPANGYGTPSEYSYVCHEYYGPNGVGYEGNPAFILGETYASNTADFQVVIPEGGFAITSHSNGANSVASAVAGRTYTVYDESGTLGEEEAIAFNKTHGEWSTRKLQLNEAAMAIDVYDLATHVTFSGDYSGAFEGDAETATYTRTIKMFQGKKVSFSYYDGMLSLPINELNYTIDGDYGAEKSVSLDPDNANALIINKTGNYTFTLNVKTNTFTIAREIVTDFEISFIDIVGKAPAKLGVEKNGSYTLPSPTEVPAGYTFAGWVKGDRSSFATTGTYTYEEDLTLYASYQKDGKLVAYSGKLGGLTVDFDSTLAYWSENTVLHDRGSWNTNGWRFYVVVDAQGRVCYAVSNPPAGYGGPTEYTYMSHDYYKADGVGYEGNPAIEILEGFGPWEPGGSAHNQFTITVPEGGFAISSYAPDNAKVLAMLTNIANWDLEAHATINNTANDANNILSYDATANELYFSLF